MLYSRADARYLRVVNPELRADLDRLLVDGDRGRWRKISAYLEGPQRGVINWQCSCVR